MKYNRHIAKNSTFQSKVCLFGIAEKWNVLNGRYIDIHRVFVWVARYDRFSFCFPLATFVPSATHKICEIHIATPIKLDSPIQYRTAHWKEVANCPMNYGRSNLRLYVIADNGK